MKKAWFLLLSILLIAGYTTGCSRDTISVGEMSKDFTNIEITDSTTGSIMTLDEKQSDELYDKLKDLEFVKKQSSEDTEEWSYSLRFLKDTKELDRFTIQDSNTINYNSYIHEAKDGEINLDYLMSFFYQIFEAEIIEAGDSLLIAPEPDSDAYRSSDKIYASIRNAEILDQEGNAISSDQLKPGYIVRIAFNGVIAESYPAQITASRVELLGRNNLLDGFKALIDDVYREDSALNSDITKEKSVDQLIQVQQLLNIQQKSFFHSSDAFVSSIRN